MTVSATHEASAIATTASTAVPPSARISDPTSAVADVLRRRRASRGHVTSCHEAESCAAQPQSICAGRAPEP